MLKKSLFISILCVFSTFGTQAQGTAGKDFWVGFMAHDWSCYYNQWWWTGDTVELFISSQVAATVNVEAPGQSFSTSITLEPNVTSMVRLPREVVCRYSDTITTNGVHVYSSSVINVYAVNRFWFSKGATVVIPTESIVQSPEYFVTTNEEKYSWTWYCNGKNFNSSEFVIVGIADSSVIEIVPTGASTRYTNKNTPFQVKLLKGQTFQYMTTDKDLSGSIIRSKYPQSKYAVFAGNRLSFTGSGSQGSCWSSWDHIYEQMLPTVAWGSNYSALPFKNNLGGYYMKVMAAENNTRIYINGSYYTSLNQAEFFEIDIASDTPTSVVGSKRISVAQFTKGYQCNGHPKNGQGGFYLGDPSMTMLFPNEQLGQSATINTVSQNNWWWGNWSWWWWNTNEHYVSIMTKTADKDSFKIDNNPVSTSWKTSANIPGYSYTAVKIDSGSHYLYSKRGFLGYVYGYGYVEGYGYAAAANFRPIQNNFLIENAQCKKDTIKFSAIVNDSFADFKWRFGDNSALATGPVARHKYADTGWYSVTMWCKHIRTGHLDSVTKDIYVADTKIKSLFDSDTAYCGPINIIVMSKNFNIDNEYKWNDGHVVYYRSIKNPGVYWMDVTERNGCVFRDTLRITNSGIPKAAFSVSDTLFCLSRNKNVKFVNFSTSNPKDTIKDYTWDFGNKVVTTTHKDSIVYHKFTTSNTFPVILRATTTKGCYHDTFMVVDVLPSPKADFAFVKKDTCFNTNAITVKNNTVVKVNDHKRFKWVFESGQPFGVYSNTNPSGAVTYANKGQYKVMLIYENNNGCIDTLVKTVKVVPNPKAGFTFVNSIFCSRDTIPFTSTSTSSFYPLSFNWKWGDSTNSTDSMPKKAYTKAGTFNVKLVITSPQGCRDSVTKSIFVNSTPLVDFTINKDTQCLTGNLFHFTNKTKFGTGVLNYTWNLGDGGTSTDSNVRNKTYVYDSVYTVRLSTTTTVGCVAKATKKVYIGGYPDARFIVNPVDQCFRDNKFTFTNQSTVKKGAILKNSWYLGNGDSAFTTSIANQHYNTEDTFTVKLISRSDLGCTDTALAKVVTYAQPKADFKNISPVQCFDQHAISLQNQSKIKYGTMTYLWKFGDNTSSSTVDAQKQYSTKGVYQVALIATSNHNCHDTIFKTLTLNASPKADFSINQASQCFRNNKFDFTNSSTIGQGSITDYDWDMGDLTIFSGPDVKSKFYNTEDTFYVRMIVKSDQGCLDTVKKMVVTYAQPKAAYSINTLTQCFKQHDFKLKNQTQIKYGSLTYEWNFGDGKTSTDTNVNKKYSKDSTYYIRLVSVSDHGCRDTNIQSVILNVSPDALYQADKNKQCFRGNAFNFTNQSRVSKGVITDYTWEMGNLATFSSVDVKNYTYLTEDTFKVRLIAHTDKNCYDTITKLAITFAQPVVQFDIPNDSQCWQKNYFVIVNKTKLKYGTLTNSWDFGDNTYSSDFSPADKKYPNASADYTMKYKAVSDHGCSDSGQHRIVLLERPISEFTINDSIQCFKGHLFSFKNNTTFSVMSTLRYWWDYANGDTSIGILPKTAKYNNPGLYNVRLISYSYLTNCYDTLFKTMIPAPHANVDYAMNNDSQCLRFNKFVMSNNSKVQFGSMTYKWSFGDGTFDTATNPVKSYLTDNAYRIKLVATTNYDCKDSIDKTIGFYPTPKALFNINDVSQCVNKHFFNLTNGSTIKSGTLTHEWWFSDNTGSSGLHATKTFSTAENHDIRLAVLSGKGCKDTLVQQVYLEKDKNSTIDFIENDSQCLKGNQFNFTNTNINSKVSFVNSKWVYGDGQESALPVPATQTFNTDGTFKVMLVTESAVGCWDTTYANVLIHPHPVTDFTADKVCFPEPTQFNNLTSIKTGSIQSYKWEFGDGNTSNVTDPLHAYSAHGKYSVKLIATSIYGCTHEVKKDSVAVVQQKPKADFTFTSLPTLVLDETRFQLNNHSSANTSKYDWDFGNFTYSNLINPIALYKDTGSYKVRLIAYTDEGCSDTMIKPTGVVLPDFFYFLPSAFSPNEDVHNGIYKGQGTIFVYSFSMQIFNRWGEKMFETNDIHKGWDGYYNGELCMEGAYLCKVQIVPFKGTLKTYQQMFQLMR